MVAISSLSTYKLTFFVLSLIWDKICESSALTRYAEHLDSGLVDASLTICKTTYKYRGIWISHSPKEVDSQCRQHV